MTALPFSDLESSAVYLADLLSDAEPAFSSICIEGERAASLAGKLATRFRVDTVSGQSADVIVSWDVVHTLPSTDRAHYVTALAQAANRELIIACPLGTDLQTAIYRSLAKLCAETKWPVPAEIALAAKHGLPTPQEAASWAHGFADLDLFYAGDVAFFQARTTEHILRANLSPLRKLSAKLGLRSGPPVEPEAPLFPETVPMRRHRRLFLLIRKR
ncbi:MAG: hypothetical protein IPG71_08025 [bacterium]|nr:hypothetical protein [bacterium]